ncbi:MAG: hypothetical protein H6Q89_5149 [Myxococcaceae bacterium]|nr:hypothetical protein [Myxococcaceae bacterium]
MSCSTFERPGFVDVSRTMGASDRVCGEPRHRGGSLNARRADRSRARPASNEEAA